MKILIVIPTYNEKDNIKKLIPVIKKYLPAADVLVVDDKSPDGTGAAVRAIARSNKKVRLMERKGKLGLGTAYVDGFKYALSLIHISEPTRLGMISYAVFCLKKN